MSDRKQTKGTSSKRKAANTNKKQPVKRLTVEEQRELERANKKALIIELLPRKNYHIGKVCEAVGISRRQFYRWMEDDEEFNEKVEDKRAYDIDDSEEKMKLLRHGVPKLNADGKLVGWIVKPHFGALITHLKAKAKDRGYGDSLSITNENGELRTMSDEELMAEAAKLYKIAQDGKWDTSRDQQGKDS